MCMKTCYKFLCFLLLLPLTVNSQVVYTFDEGGNGYTADGGTTYTNMVQYPSVGTGGTFETATLSTLGAAAGGDGNVSTVFHGKTRTNNTASVDLTAFTACTDQQVVWKMYLKTATTTSKGVGVVLRAQSGASAYSASLRQGYFFSCYGSGTSGTVKFRVGKPDGTNTAFQAVKGETSQVIAGFTNGPLYLRAKAVGTKLYFDYSLDGTTFTAFAGSPYTDATFPNAGTVQIAWALGSGSGLDQYYDDVKLTNLDVPKLTINGNNKYVYDGTNDQLNASFDINSAGYKNFTNQAVDVPVVTYEFKGIGTTSYAQSSTAPSAVGTYAVIGKAVSALHNQSAADTLAFEILPNTYQKYYTFVDDAVGSAADSTYFFANGHKVQNGIGSILGYSTRGNMLQPSAATSLTTLARFGTTDSISTNYSVVWKSYSAAAQQKRGVVLRASGDNRFLKINGNTVNTGQGYMFYINNNATDTTTQMDIRKLHAYADSAVYKTPTVMATKKVPSTALYAANWYRATAKDSVLTFEYSLDGANWTVACTAIDSAFLHSTLTFPKTYSSGTTQLSGINAAGTSYYYDYILYSDLSLPLAITPALKSNSLIAVNVNGGLRMKVESYDIYSIQGVQLYTVRNSDLNNFVRLNPGIYIVKSRGVVQKVIVK